MVTIWSFTKSMGIPPSSTVSGPFLLHHGSCINVMMVLPLGPRVKRRDRETTMNQGGPSLGPKPSIKITNKGRAFQFWDKTIHFWFEQTILEQFLGRVTALEVGGYKSCWNNHSVCASLPDPQWARSGVQIFLRLKLRSLYYINCLKQQFIHLER